MKKILFFLLFAFMAIIGESQIRNYYELASNNGGIFLKGNTSKINNSDPATVVFNLSAGKEYILSFEGQDVIFKFANVTYSGEFVSIEINPEKNMTLYLYISTSKKGQYSYCLTYKQ